MRLLIYQNACCQRVLFHLDGAAVVVSGSTVTVRLNTALTAKPLDASYVLRNVTDAVVLTPVTSPVVPMPSGV